MSGKRAFDDIDDPVTRRNPSMVLYFDPGRSRLMEGEDAFYDLSRLRDRMQAQFWCAANGIEFHDHRLERYPSWLRAKLMRARAAGASGLREKKPRWCPVTFGVDVMWVPQIASRPVSRNAAKAQASEASQAPAPRKRSKSVFWCSDDGVNFYALNSKGERADSP